GHFLDSFRCRQASTEPLRDLPTPEWLCTPDLPLGEFDLALLPVDARGEAELARDWLQQMHRVLVPGGELLAASNNPEDQWLHQELQRLFGKVTRTPARRGVLYACRRTDRPARYKQFDCELAFRDEGRLIPLFTRPGVFSHRSLDTGARVLIEGLNLRPGERVVDLGCGSGAVGIAAALRAPEVQLLALDSNPRAIECTRRGAAASGVTNLTAVLDDTGQGGEAGHWDLVLGNPPYFSEYRIAEIFLESAHRLLRPGGRVHMVTKTPSWFEEHMANLFDDIESHPSRAYHVVSGCQRELPPPPAESRRRRTDRRLED
ncbi:MAG: class I SAM-dependent methyltransferase, partial [Planctomycetaceae bacterium]